MLLGFWDSQFLYEKTTGEVRKARWEWGGHLACLNGKWRIRHSSETIMKWIQGFWLEELHSSVHRHVPPIFLSKIVEGNFDYLLCKPVPLILKIKDIHSELAFKNTRRRTVVTANSKFKLESGWSKCRHANMLSQAGRRAHEIDPLCLPHHASSPPSPTPKLTTQQFLKRTPHSPTQSPHSTFPLHTNRHRWP
jgi:hypothetical protein